MGIGMDSPWLTAYLVFSELILVWSLLLALLTWEHRRYVRSCMRDIKRHQPSGRVALFVPCKGIDLGLRDNLRALMQQDYDDYEVTFIVESMEDAAYPVIRRLMAEYPWVPTRVVVAGQAVDSGQKVHNLRVATEHLSRRVKYLAFVDSDARPRPEWLRMLVARLNQPGLGAVTGYRWFTPQRPTLANALVYSMNCDVVSLLTRSSHYLIWGGSWAIRREVFDAIRLWEAWQGTLSDDLVASRLLRKFRLPVRFEPAAVVASPLDESLLSALSFIRRQYLIARSYTFDWWLLSLASAMFTNLLWLGNLSVLVASLITGFPPVWMPLSVLAALYAVTVYRGWLRQDLVKTYFPHWIKASRLIRWCDMWLNPAVELAHWIGITAAAFGRWISWRGIRYRLLAGGQVAEIVRPSEATPIAEDQPACYRKAA